MLTRKVDIVNSGIVLKQPGRYIGWPTIEKASWGELLAVFSGDRDRHVCPFGKVQMVRSTDNGETWSNEITIQDGIIDDRDAGIIETKAGTLILSWFTSIRYSQGIEAYLKGYGAETVERWKDKIAIVSDTVCLRDLGSWICRSLDRGVTWEQPISVKASAPHGPVQLNEGSLLYVGKTASIYTCKAIVVEKSTDDGLTWNVISTIPIPADLPMERISEPHVVETDEGKLIVMIRHECKGEQAYMYQSESKDGGYTWSLAEKTEIWGFPPHLRRLADGRLLLSYARRREPFGQRAVLSCNGGRSWDIENTFEISNASNGDLGYPSSVEMDDGSIYTLYYQQDPEEKPGDSPCLMWTRWHIPN